VKIGIDFWGTISHNPDYFRMLASFYMRDMRGPLGKDHRNEVHVISSIGPRRIGTIEQEVIDLNVPCTAVHELVFRHPSQSPALKVTKCLELGIEYFYDDRQDVVDALNKAGIICFKVPRLGNESDVQSERR
jgi:hypothetical protein